MAARLWSLSGFDMFGTFYQSDVEILLKDITGLVEPQPASVREPLIQSGVHYSEMLPVEYVPTDEYMKLFEDALERYAVITAEAVLKVATKIYKAKRGDVVLVSLARAGIPVGVLIKRCLRSVCIKLHPFPPCGLFDSVC